MKNFIHKLNLPESKTLLKIDLPSRKREWMDVNNGHAYKCLPLSVANGYGWHIMCPISFEAIWNGSTTYKDAINFTFHGDGSVEDRYIVEENLISSHFGNGIITFSGMNYILKTSENNNLFVKGPTNYFKHGAQALEAIIETDWIPYTFTLNWKITKPNETVTFIKGEPIATIFPMPRKYLETFEAEEIQMDKNNKFYIEHQKWAAKRQDLKTTNKEHNYYTRGVENTEENKIFKDHQRSIIGCPFLKNSTTEKDDNGTEQISSKNI